MKVTELQVKENSDGELYFELPDELMSHLGWEVGDDLKFIEKDNGYLIKKVKYETIELDFDDEELLKYMMLAHEENITFNELCERAMKEQIKKLDENNDK